MLGAHASLGTRVLNMREPAAAGTSAAKPRQHILDQLLQLVAGGELSARRAGLEGRLRLVGETEHEVSDACLPEAAMKSAAESDEENTCSSANPAR